MLLCQSHSVTEFSGGEVGASPETDEPSPVLLKHTFAGVTERITKGIETGFGGVALVSSVVEFHGIFINLSNEVPEQVDLRNSVCRFNHCVVLAPVAVALDCFGHLLFDLTHGRLNSFDSFTIDDFGTCAKNV